MRTVTKWLDPAAAGQVGGNPPDARRKQVWNGGAELFTGYPQALLGEDAATTAMACRLRLDPRGQHPI